MNNSSKLKSILVTLLVASCAALGTTSCSDKSKPKKNPAANTPDPKLNDEPDLPELTADGEAPLRGYVNLSRLIGNSIATPDQIFDIAEYVGGNQYNPGLGLLMGYYDGNALTPGWRNTSSNTVNTTVYLLAFDALGRDLAVTCKNLKPNVKLKPSFNEVVKSICASGLNTSPDELHKFWSGITAQKAPETEFVAWIDTIRSASPASNDDLFSLMATSAMMVPAVLFEN